LKTDKAFSPAHYELGRAFLKMGMVGQAYPELQTAVNLAPGNIPARVELGNLLLQGRLPDRAADQANAILKAQPNNPDGLAMLANVAAEKGQHDEALAAINKALAVAPNRSDLHAMLGVMEGQGGKDLPGARKELEKAVELDGKNVQARMMLSALLNTQKDFAGAETQLKAAIAAAPKALQPRVALAALYLSQNNQSAAESSIRQTSDDFADDLDGAGMLERFYERSGHFDKAEPAYADLASKHPKSFPIQIAYARILAIKGNFAKANEIVNKQAEAHDGEIQYTQVKAGLLLHDGKSDDAFALLQKGVRNNPESTDLKLLLATVARDRGDLNTANTNYLAALQRAPGNMAAAAGVAEMAARRGDQAGLRQVSEQMVKLYPNAPAPYIWRGTAEANDGHMDLAVDNLQKALKLDPKNAQALAEIGEIRVKQGKNAEGRAMLEQALAIDPNSAALPMLVQLDLQANQPAAALARMQAQIARNPNSVPLLVQLAQVQMASRDPHAAVETAQKAMKLSPDNLPAMRVYTEAGLASNDLNGPNDLWTKWAGSHPQDAQAQSYLAMLAEASGDQTRAISFYQKSLQIQPEQPTVENNLAYLMAETGQNMDVALTLAQAAQRAMPNSPDTSDTLAWVYYKKGVYSSALDLLQGAVKTAPQNASIHYHMGLAYEKLNNKTAATASFKKAVENANGADVGKKAQAELDRLG
ncbi:MAG: tetratricopeptide repeat protein, partial [Janthinobacterium lividum]